jgi:hypothetical protein
MWKYFILLTLSQSICFAEDVKDLGFCFKYLQYLKDTSANVLGFGEDWTIDANGKYETIPNGETKYKNTKNGNEITYEENPRSNRYDSHRMLKVELGDNNKIKTITSYKIGSKTRGAVKQRYIVEETRREFKYKDENICYPHEQRSTQEESIGTDRPTFNLELCDKLKKLNLGKNEFSDTSESFDAQRRVATLLDEYHVAPYEFDDRNNRNMALIKSHNAHNEKDKSRTKDGLKSQIILRAINLLQNCQSLPGEIGKAFKSIYPEQSSQQPSKKKSAPTQ